MWSKARMVTLVPVRNMNRAIKFYTKGLGGKVMDRAPGKMKDMWASLRLGKEELWFIVPSKWEKRTLAYQSFLVRNIKGVVTELQRKGVKFEKPDEPSPGARVEGPITIEPFGSAAFFKDSEGNLLMVWENNPPM